MKINFDYKALFITIIIFLILGVGCIYWLFFTQTRLYVKEVKLSDITVIWFNYSHISNVTPYYIIAKKDNKVDTLCISYQIMDFYIKKDTIFIDLYNPPRLEYIVPPETFGYTVIIDTTSIKIDNEIRSSFKK